MKGIIFLSFLNRKSALTALAALAFCIIGCSDLTESDAIETSAEFNATALKASIVGNVNATNFSRYLTRRFANKSARASAGTKAIIVTKSLYALDGSDLAAIKSVYDSGGAVVVIDPAADKLKEFLEAIGHSEGFGTAGAANGASGSFCDAYIFNNSGNNLVVDYTRSSREGWTITEEDYSDEGAGEEGAAITKAEQPTGIEAGQTETDYAAVIDEVIKWIENPPAADTPHTAGARAASDVQPGGDISDLSLANTYTRIFQISSAGTTYYDGSDMTGSTTISNTQYVWQCYSFDQDKEYYLVEEDIVIPNSGMYRGIWKHYHFPLDWKECGLYMTWVSVDSKLLGENGNPVPLGGTVTSGSTGGVLIPHSSPVTTNETVITQSRMDWQVGGLIGLGKKKTNNTNETETGGLALISGGVTFEKYTAFNIQDLKLVNYSSSDGANARFDYTTNVVSTYSTGSNTMRPPADLAVSTAQFTHYWRWEISNPKRFNGGDNGGGTHSDTGAFGMCTNFKIQYEEAAAWGGSGSTKRWQLNKEDPASNFTWWFPAIDRNNRG